MSDLVNPRRIKWRLRVKMRDGGYFSHGTESENVARVTLRNIARDGDMVSYELAQVEITERALQVENGKPEDL